MSLSKLPILLLFYFTFLGTAFAQNLEKVIPKKVITEVLFETDLQKYLHYDLPDREILFINSDSLLNFDSINDPRVKIVRIQPRNSSINSNIIEIISWEFANGIYKLSLDYEIEGIYCWFKFEKQNDSWILIDTRIIET